MIKCTINDQTVEVEEGSSIIQAFKQCEIDIAHYCWHPGLSVAGVCRLCMVEIKGHPKLEIACNTLVKEGMVISNQSQKVKDTVRWGLEFHLINHPLDCPICDQAGECVLQEQYMKFGAYQPQMAENKVKKRKVVDLGSKIVLDTERCILCARCTRFTDEVSKTKELGIFNRGDHSEIGIFKDKPLENDYALNTVDICPVGALTSKKFRFQQRVWYLKKAASICTGCSTGCSTYVYYNEEGLWRILPRHNDKINGHWMCDKGRETFEHVNKKNRSLWAYKHTEKKTVKMDIVSLIKNLKKEWDKDKKTALVLTGSYTLEEYESFLNFYTNYFSSKNIYHWKNNVKTFDFYDGFLIRGDKNPNTKGLLKILEDFEVKKFDQLEKDMSSIEQLIVCGPENSAVYDSLEDRINVFLKCPQLLWIAPYSHKLLKNPQKTIVWTVPSKTYFEKSGSFINAEGRVQKFKAIGQVVEEVVCLRELASLFQQEEGFKPSNISLESEMKTNHFLKSAGSL